jgi:DNA processing protein
MSVSICRSREARVSRAHWLYVMNDTKYWIALEQAHGIGPAHLIEIHESLKGLGLSLADVCDLSADDIKKEFRFHEKIAAALADVPSLLPKIEEDYFKLLESGIEVIPFFSELYPRRLHETLGSGVPPLLYAYGNAQIFKLRGAAILGDKEVSEKGEMISFAAARILADHRIPVISGYAQGADLIAHRSALINGGSTIAFVPYGIFHLSAPEILRDVMDMERTLIVSPFYPDREANKYNAFIRNKIICALSQAVYIVEAPTEGGIFEAAKSARNLNVPLFTTEYAEYPKNAGGNKIIIEEMGGIPVLGKIEKDMLVPNMDNFIGVVKFK